MARRWVITPFDSLMLVNLLLWSGVILFGYRWRNLEFYLYLLLVLFQASGMLVAWWVGRRLTIPIWVLVALQVAVLLHLTGGSVFVGGTRLYDLMLIPAVQPPVWFSHLFRYDKLVHGYFAAVGFLSLAAVWPQLAGASARGFHLVVILLTVMGICAIVEVAEYLGTMIAYLPEVGGYDNNLQDLLANLAGAMGGAAGRWWTSAGAGRRTVLRAAAGFLVLLLVVPIPGALLLAFPPRRPLTTTPANYGLAYQNVTFRSERDNARLEGWYMPAPSGGERAVVLVHGWLNDRLIHGRGLPLAQVLVQQGYSVLLFDLGGHGQSQPVRVSLGDREQGDLRAALRLVRDQGATQVAVVGFSIGAAAAILTAESDPTVVAVVADSAFTDRDTLLERLLTEKARIPRPYAAYAQWLYHQITGSSPRAVQPGQAVAGLVARPLLFIHGTDDRVIPPTESERLHQQAPGSQLWVVAGARHTHSFEADPSAYIDRITRFLQDAMDQPRTVDIRSQNL